MPWAIGAAALVTYSATLNHWLTLSSLAVVTEVSGRHWQPSLYQPVLFLLTWPLRWLPASWAPLALNLLAAVCASLTLAVLGRSVALLPQDRLEQQRRLVQNPQGLLSLPSAWVPPVLAAGALGLQLTFWENATAASASMLELLLFAGVIWCLLEHRRAPEGRWLDRAALVCGLALANGWTIAGFLPLLALALMRSKRMRFFRPRFLGRIEAARWRQAAPQLKADLRFLLRMAAFGLLGLSPLLLLPLLQAVSPDSSLGFGAAVRVVLRSYKANLFLLGRLFLWRRDVPLLLGAVSLAPVLLLSIRWQTFTGRERRRGFDLVSLTFYAAHALLLLTGVAVAFDPPFSPRQLSRELGLTLPFLGLYYLAALSIGYYAGFFLLIFSGHVRPHAPVRRALRWVAPKLVYVLLGLTLAGLFWKNAPTLGLTNGPQLERYARLVLGSLPPEGAVVLSGDPARLALLQAALNRAGQAGRYVPMDAEALAQAPYRAWLRRNYPRPWPAEAVAPKPPTPGGSTPSADLALDEAGYLRLIERLAQSNRLCCLEPGLGALAEACDFQPHGLVYELRLYPPKALSGAPLTAGKLAGNQAFWERVVGTEVDPLMKSIAGVEHPQPGFSQRLLQRTRLSRPLPGSLSVLARWYSSALNAWGVALQRQERWPAARPCFAKASELNPENLPAQVNLERNGALLAGQPPALLPAKAVEERLGKYRTWGRVLANDGPFDEPSYCYQLGLVFARGKLWRQALQQLDRAQALAPKETNLRLALGNLLNRCQMPDQALRVAAGLQAEAKLQPLEPKALAELAFLEADAWFAKTNQAQAAAILQSLLDAHPGDPALLNRTKLAFTLHASYTDALRLTEQQLQGAPDNIPALLDKGLLYLLAGEFSNAIPVFTHALSLTNSYAGRVNRARAYLRADQWDAAQADYQELLRAFPASYQPYFGLAEVARARGDTNGAIRYYRQYLSKAPTNQAEFPAVTARLQSLQPRAR